MSRVGWIILAVILLVVAAFASMTRFGGAVHRRASLPAALPTDSAAAQLVIPVQGVDKAALQDSWGDPREAGGRAHQGVDIMAARGTPVIAATVGRVEKLFQSERGGTTLYVRSPDRRWIYYYAHLSGYAPGIREGQAVRAGEAIGFVGDTGDAGPGNYHLHFGMQRMTPDQSWWQGEAVNPYPLLAAGPVPR